MEGVIVAGGGQRVVVSANHWGEYCDVLYPVVVVCVAVEMGGAVVDA